MYFAVWLDRKNTTNESCGIWVAGVLIGGATVCDQCAPNPSTQLNLHACFCCCSLVDAYARRRKSLEWRPPVRDLLRFSSCSTTSSRTCLPRLLHPDMIIMHDGFKKGQVYHVINQFTLLSPETLPRFFHPSGLALAHRIELTISRSILRLRLPMAWSYGVER